MKSKLILFALTLLFVLGLGTMQALSSSTAEPALQPGNDSDVMECVIEDEGEGVTSCTAWACQAECGEFGGDFIAGVCYCCG